MPLLMRLGTLPILKTIVRSQMQKPTRDSTRAFWAQLMVAHPERLDDDFLDVSTASQARNATSWFTLIDSTVDVRGMKQDLVLGDRWKQLNVPTTLIWGEKDGWCPPEVGEAVAATNPQLRVVRIADAGHAPWFDEPDRVVNAIQEALADT